MTDEEIALGLEGDPILLARVSAAARMRNDSLAAYLHGAVCRFLERAAEEDWSTAMARMQSDPAPGDRLLELAVERQLQRDGV